MAFLRELGSGNPFSTRIGTLVESATDGSQESEDWGKFMQICDLINACEEGAKDAIKAIKKRLTSSGKSYQCISYTLTLLETCVKNCGSDSKVTSKFHLQLATSGFLHELFKVIAPKHEPPPYLQEKILILIQTWSETFKNNPDMSEIQKFYKDLQSKGIEFPISNINKQVPILTPRKHLGDETDSACISLSASSSLAAASIPPSATTQPQATSQPSKAFGKPFSPAHLAKSSKYQILDETEPSGPPSQEGGTTTAPRTAAPTGTAPSVTIKVEQMEKLKKEFEIVNQNRKVLSDMLQEYSNNPNDTKPADKELIEELNNTCRDMQKRVVQLIARIENEQLTGDLLMMNDSLNNVFLRYDRYKRQGQSKAEQREDADGEPSLLLHRPTVPTANLIDFDAATDASDIDVKMSSATISTSSSTTAAAASASDDFDNLARRGDAAAPSVAGGAGPATIRKSLHIERDSDFNEMEEWLKTNPEDASEGTTEAFDKFLVGRSTDADKKNDLVQL